MRRVILAAVVICIMVVCGSCSGKRPSKLTTSESKLAAQVGFDRSVMTAVMRRTDGKIVRLKGLDQGGYETTLKGISFGVPENEVESTLDDLRPELAAKGYFVFLAEMNFGEKPDQIGVMKTKDQFEVVRARQTNGINYDIDNKAVIARLRQWDKLYGIEITGVGMDWVQFSLKRLPKDMTKFAKEVYKFCPDSVDQGPGDISDLEDSMRKAKEVYLWWD